MKVTIRNAKPEDWKVIQKLNSEVFVNDASNDEFLDLSWPISKQGVEYYKNVTSDEKYCCLIAEIKGKQIGYLVGAEKIFDYRKVKLAEIQNMGVSPKYRSKRIGKKLVETFRRWCRENGFERIYVNAYLKNKRAQKFYKKCRLKPADISFEGNVD